MGIIIAPIALLTLAISVYAIIQTITQLRHKEIGLKELIIALLVSVSILVLVREVTSSAYQFLTLMFYQSIVPFIFHIITSELRSSKLRYCSNIALISVGISLIFHLSTICFGENLI